MKIKEQIKTDIIISSLSIKKRLHTRFEELNITPKQIVKESKKYISGLNEAKISSYFKYDIPMTNFPTQKQLLYLCVRYGILLKIKSKIEPYNEEICIKNVQKTFVNEI